MQNFEAFNSSTLGDLGGTGESAYRDLAGPEDPAKVLAGNVWLLVAVDVRQAPVPAAVQRHLDLACKKRFRRDTNIKD